MRIRMFLAVTTAFSWVFASGAAIADPSAGNGDLDEAFLALLVGDWEMKGRARPTESAPWYNTGSSMSAYSALNAQAVQRDIAAPFINLEAKDFVWFHPATGQYTYVYLSSNVPQAIVMQGSRTGDREITVIHEESNSKTVIRLINNDEMVAQDFETNADGSEWMSREVFHYREKKDE
ncbi:MAG: hypothetical protein AAF351_07380 [Pseudomonadota bacterium]